MILEVREAVLADPDIDCQRSLRDFVPFARGLEELTEVRRRRERKVVGREGHRRISAIQIR